MPSLIEIAEFDGVVLFDSSVIDMKDFPRIIYDAKKYADLDRNLLLATQSAIHSFIEFIEQENAFTVEGALEDFEGLQRVISDKQRFLNMQQREMPQRDSRNGRKQELFGEISDIIFHILRYLKSGVFRADNGRVYNTLYSLIPYLLGLSKPTDLAQTQLPERYCQLYAAAFYLSLHGKIPVTLVLRGNKFVADLIELAKKFSRGGPKDPQYRCLRQYPIRVYEPIAREYELSFSTK